MVMIVRRIHIKVYQRNSVTEIYRLTYYKFSYVSNRNWDSAVSIETGYGMDDRGVGVLVPVGLRSFFSARRPERLWDSLNLHFNGYRGKAVGA
jgi:hypothetical protein